MKRNVLNSIVALFLGMALAMLLNLFMPAPVRADIPTEEEGVCARVRIRISQDVAITRTAFKATLEITNAPENVALENVSVTLEIWDIADTPSIGLFGVTGPVLTGISDMAGTGRIDPGTEASGVWTIVPTRDAAPDLPTRYWVGGTLSYMEGTTAVNIELFPAMITVKPDPLLVLRYFLVREVYSDDPFTKDIVEPAEPFPLGLILTNEGKGWARNIHITSSQPEIIENEKGLLVDFKIIGTQVNLDEISPSLAVNFGDIGPDQSAVARWLMTVSLQGRFIEYSATFEHVDDLGDPRTSLIDHVEIHEILKDVRIDLPEDDLKPDFLANDVADAQHLPDTLYSSDGTIFPVNVGLNPLVSGEVSSGNLQVTLNVTVPSGWVYIRVQDPGLEQFRLAQVIRSDGREIMVEENAWTTHRTYRPVGEPTFRDHSLHLLDMDSTGIYTLIYEVGDYDQDGIPDDVDNCVGFYNPGQDNTDRANEHLPGYPPGDNMGDACDADDDNDGFLDIFEVNNQSNPYVAVSTPVPSFLWIHEGMNLVSIPADPVYRPMLSDWLPVLGTPAEIERVVVYDKALGRYVDIIPGDPAAPEHLLDPGEGFIVYSNVQKDIVFPSKLCASHDLVPGLNLIGVACPAPDLSAYGILGGLGPANASSMQRFDIFGGQMGSVGILADGTTVGENFIIFPGAGYMLWMRNAVPNVSF